MGNAEEKKRNRNRKKGKEEKISKNNASQWSDRTVIKTVKEISKVFNLVKYAKDTSITMPEGKRKRKGKERKKKEGKKKKHRRGQSRGLSNLRRPQKRILRGYGSL